jgi:ABC-2 type transport system permease protein
MTAMPETTGTIYDIGYRHYDGPRLGRRGAIGAIVGAGLRAVFGFGRSGRSKIIPWGAVILAALPAVVAVAVRVLAGDILDLYDYDGYVWNIGALLPIFIAAQAPELVVNDIRHRVLPLYFSRPIRRIDYVVAKIAALAIGLLAITLAPVLLLYIGRVLSTDDLVAAVGDEIGAMPEIIGSGAIHAVVLASIGLAICSLAGRRAYAAGAVLAVFLIGGVISDSFSENGQDVAAFVRPLAVLDGTRQWLFGGAVDGAPAATSELPLALYGLAALILVLVSWAVLAFRYRRLTA